MITDPPLTHSLIALSEEKKKEKVHLTCDLVTCDMLHMTPDRWGDTHPLKNFIDPSKDGKKCILRFLICKQISIS